MIPTHQRYIHTIICFFAWEESTYTTFCIRLWCIGRQWYLVSYLARISPFPQTFESRCWFHGNHSFLASRTSSSPPFPTSVPNQCSHRTDNHRDWRQCWIGFRGRASFHAPRGWEGETVYRREHSTSRLEALWRYGNSISQATNQLATRVDQLNRLHAMVENAECWMLVSYCGIYPVT